MSNYTHIGRRAVNYTKVGHHSGYRDNVNHACNYQNRNQFITLCGLKLHAGDAAGDDTVTRRETNNDVTCKKCLAMSPNLQRDIYL
jgi:hypothetical protein